VTIAGSPLDGAIARTLAETTLDGTTLNLNFANTVTMLTAGTPYLIKWDKADGYVDDDAHNIVSPTFTAVTIAKGTTPVTTSYVNFVGTYDYQSFTEDNRSILFVGSENKLYWPQTGAHLGACRAYFQLNNGLTAADVSSGARMSFDEGNDEVTSLNLTPALSQGEGAWYTLDGRKVANGQKPSQRHTLTERIAKGLYIHHGKKVVK
jgi:hypothetical protein